MELRMYSFRIYPSKKQKSKFIDFFKICKKIYNELLALSMDSWKYGNIVLNKFDFCENLTGRYTKIYSQVRHDVSDRVHKAFQNFFRRIKSKEKKKGFPRFKSRVNSITYPQFGFKLVSNKRLKMSKVGNIPIILHRIPKGKIKNLTIKQNKAGQWFAIFTCEIDTPKIKHKSTKKVGIDLGLESYATFSNGKFIDNPRHIIKAEKMIKKLQRRLSKKKKGSVNKRKARFRLAKKYIKVANQRTDFMHKLSHNITKSYSFIAIEELNIKKMIKNHRFAKSINDASWNCFMKMLSYKAVICGGQLIKVNPRNTSKTCSKCKTIIKMSLSKREFLCPNCGFVCHRDINAANNILCIGQDLSESTPVDDYVRPSIAKAVVDEAGTIFGNS